MHQDGKALIELWYGVENKLVFQESLFHTRCRVHYFAFDSAHRGFRLWMSGDVQLLAGGSGVYYAG